MPLHRTVHLLGFKKPVVNDEHIIIDVACATGEIMSVQITRSLWRQLDTAVLAAEVASHLPGSAAPKKACRHHATNTALAAAWADLVAGSRVKLETIATNHGLAAQTLGNWCRKNHPEEYAVIMRARKGRANLAEQAAAGLPLSRPSAS